MPLIQLSNGGEAIVDDEDFARLSRWKWHRSQNGYAMRTTWKGKLPMHRAIIDCPLGLEVDHINRDKLDNRRNNLRAVTHSTNQRNAPAQRNNTSGFRGVSFDRGRGKWRAATKVDGKHKLIGRYETAEQASEAYESYVRAIMRVEGLA